MKFKVIKLLLIPLMLGAFFITVSETAYIADTFQEKSLYSYMLKTGDTNPMSAAAMTHIRESKAYGYKVALRVGFSSAVIGLLFGIYAVRWLRRRKRNEANK